MLKAIDPLLSPELLCILRAMGHGDEIAIVDSNFPATTNARRLIRLGGTTATRTLDAVLSVLPLDDFERECAWRMEVVGAPSAERPIYEEFRTQLATHGVTHLGALERHAFYERARSAFAIVATGETRLYGNILLKKGVVRPSDTRRTPATEMIDAHQHFWRLDRGDYSWLTEDLAPIYQDFGPHDLAPFLDRHGIGRTVLVQAAPTESETHYLLSIAERSPRIAAVVGWADFDGGHAALKRVSTNRKLRGLRPMLQDIEDRDWILRPSCTLMLQAMAESGLVFEFLGKPRHLSAALELSERHPSLMIVLDHGMKPDIAHSDFADWKARMLDLAALPNTVCKLSGLITEAAPGWTISDLEPYVRHIVDAFGPARVMWGSDWPVVNLAGGYDTWRAATLALVDHRTEAPLVLGGTALRIYGISPPLTS
jgi:L-fuconolactonase